MGYNFYLEALELKEKRFIAQHVLVECPKCKNKTKEIFLDHEFCYTCQERVVPQFDDKGNRVN